MNRHLILGTSGHVDHGKTALIRALTGIDCDTHREEKERGITINLGFAHLDLPSGESVGIVDVPGHRDFIRTMVAGAYGIDMVMLVIAADSGIMPQTVEHLNIIRMLGIQHGVIALTKSDLVDEETLGMAKLEVMELLESTPLEHAPIIAVSSVTGSGLDQLVAAIDNLIPGIPDKEPGPVFRMYIDRLFNLRGQGYIVTGTVMNGGTEPGKEVYLLPGFDKKLKIRHIERHGKTVNQVRAGDRAALNLAGINAEVFERGAVLSDQRLPSTQMIDASLTLFDQAEKLRTWSQVIFLTGTLKSNARIHLLDSDQVLPGGSAFAQIHLDRPAILMNQDHYIIRNSSNNQTLGGGKILDINPLHHKKRTAKLVGYLNDLREAGGGRPLPCPSPNGEGLGMGYEQEAGGGRPEGPRRLKIEMRKEAGPVFTETIAAKLNATTADVLKHVNDTPDPDIRLYEVTGRSILVMTSIDESIRLRILSALNQWHQTNPLLESGLDSKGLAGKLGYASPVEKLYLGTVLDSLQQEGKIRQSGSNWLLGDFTVTVDSRMQESLSWLEKTIEGYGVRKTVTSEMGSLVSEALARGVSKQKLMMMLKYLAKEGTLYFYDDEYIHRAVADQCRILLLDDLRQKEAGINEKEFRLLIDGTKRIVQVLIGIFLEGGSITKQSFYLRITEKGKEL